MTKVYITMDRTPLFFLDEEMLDLQAPTVEVSDEFFAAYEQALDNFRVIQHALFNMYAEAIAIDDSSVDDVLDFPLEPVHDPDTLH